MTRDEELQFLLIEHVEIEETITANTAARDELREKIKALLPVESDALTEVARAILAKDKQLRMLTGTIVQGDGDDDRRLDLAATWIRITDPEVRQLQKKGRHAAYLLSLSKAEELTGYDKLQRMRAEAQ